MRIAGTEINLKHKALEIYVSGCQAPHCPGCHNPELWDFKVGEPWEKVWPHIKNKILELNKNGLVDIIWLLGGEPAHQNFTEMCEFLQEVKKCQLPIMLWSRETSLPIQIMGLISYAKLGPYIQDGEPYAEPLFGITLANREQKIVEIKNGQGSGYDAKDGFYPAGNRENKKTAS